MMVCVTRFPVIVRPAASVMSRSPVCAASSSGPATERAIVLPSSDGSKTIRSTPSADLSKIGRRIVIRRNDRLAERHQAVVGDDIVQFAVDREEDSLKFQRAHVGRSPNDASKTGAPLIADLAPSWVTPASIAGLPYKRACVKVGPPLS